MAQNNTYTSKARYVDSPIDEKSAAETENAANDFLNTLLSAEDLSSPQIRSKLQGAITIASLKEYFAKLVLSGLETAIRNGIVVGKAMRDALERATVEATEFAHDHPVYFTLIALGVLVIMAPTILEWLGFAELGPIEGTSFRCKSLVETLTENRLVCCTLAGSVRWIRAKRILVLLLSETWYDLGSLKLLVGRQN